MYAKTLKEPTTKKVLDFPKIFATVQKCADKKELARYNGKKEEL